MAPAAVARPELDSAREHGSERPDGWRGGSKDTHCAFSDGSDCWQRRRVPGRCFLILEPRTSSCCQRPSGVPSSLLLNILEVASMFWVFGSLFLRRCGGNHSSTYLFWHLSFALSSVCSLCLGYCFFAVRTCNRLRPPFSGQAPHWTIQTETETGTRRFSDREHGRCQFQ